VAPHLPHFSMGSEQNNISSLNFRCLKKNSATFALLASLLSYRQQSF